MSRPKVNSPEFDAQILAEARYLIENKATVRQVADYFGKSKTGIHNNLRLKLPEIDEELYNQVSAVLNDNKADRHNRGGAKTKRLWEEHFLEESKYERDDLIRLG